MSKEDQRLLDAGRVTSFTSCTSENSSKVSSKSWWMLVRLELVREPVVQSMSGRLKSPPMMMLRFMACH